MPCLTCTAVCAQCTTGGRCARSAAAHACAQSSRARHAQSAGSSPGRTATCRTCSAPARAACPARAPLGLPAARGKLSCRVVKLSLLRTAAQTGQVPSHACQGDAWPAAAVRSSLQTHALLWCKVAAGGAAVDSMCKAAAVAAWQGAGARTQEVEALLVVGRAGAHGVVRERVPVQLLARRHGLRPPGAAQSAHRPSRGCKKQGQSTVCGRTLACCRRAGPAGDASDGGTACAGWGGWGASARTFKTCVMPSVFSTSVRDALS